jgi:uroporphyrinogen decarboxylase
MACMEMSTYERMKCMFEHREADRIPVIDGPWDSTIERWHTEGMPEDVDYVDFFGLDHLPSIQPDNSPRYEEKVVEETDEYIIKTTRWGVTLRNWRHAGSTPEFLDFTITDPDSWQKAKKRMTPTRDRIDWAALKKDYPKWREQGCWVRGNLWFGFDVTHAWTIGTERALIATIENPEWLMDMFNHFLDVQMALLDQVWDAGYTFDSVRWWDDLGYKGRLFFSVDTFREILKPTQKRACDWAHAKGVKTELHSCGDVRALIPEFIDAGVDCLNPLEVKAGVDPVDVKKAHGNDLVLHGGINSLYWDDPDAMAAEMRRLLPTLKTSGGYICASDHSVPDSVSLEDFRRIVKLAKELGSYA